MGYSYWCSHLKQTIHIAHSVFHFPTKLSSVLQAHWYPTCVLELPFRSRRTNNTNDSTLSRFPGLFKDDIPPIIVFQLSQNQPEGLIINILMDNLKFLRTFEVFLNCYTKISDFFHLSNTLCNFFYFFFRFWYRWHSANFYVVSATPEKVVVSAGFEPAAQSLSLLLLYQGR